MASVVIAGDTSGAITLAAPSVAGTNTLTLPTLTGTILTNKTAGTVLQVVNATYSTTTSSSSTTYADTGLSASITPTSSSSKILILINHTENRILTTSGNRIQMRLVKDGNALIEFNKQVGFNNTATNIFTIAFTYLDSPATTSQITYKTQFANEQSSSAAVTVQTNSMPSTITLMEIAA